MPSSTTSNFKFNGVIDTSRSIMDNINILGNGSNCWVTMDVNTGKWSVIINRAGPSVSSFNDSNILGAITVSGTGLNELYNRVEVTFPHKDLNDEKDYVIYEIPTAQLYPNEIRNTLSLDFEIINDPIQAGLIGARELKQSRLDKVIRFTTDYSKLGLKAGDIIDVTSTMYGFNAKLFRVITIAEIDGDGGEIILEITALEYSSDVYNTGGLTRAERTRESGIISKGVNAPLINQDNKAGTLVALTPSSNAQGLSLAWDEGAQKWQFNLASKDKDVFVQDLINTGMEVPVYRFTTGAIPIDNTPITTDADFVSPFPANVTHPDCYPTGFSFTLPYTGRYKINYFVNFGGSATLDGSGNFIGIPTVSKKRVRINLLKQGQQVSLPESVTTHIKGSDPYLDITTEDDFTGTAGDLVEFYLDIKSSSDSYQNPPTRPYAIVLITGNLNYIGTT